MSKNTDVETMRQTVNDAVDDRRTEIQLERNAFDDETNPSADNDS